MNSRAAHLPAAAAITAAEKPLRKAPNSSGYGEPHLITLGAAGGFPLKLLRLVVKLRRLHAEQIKQSTSMLIVATLAVWCLGSNIAVSAELNGQQEANIGESPWSAVGQINNSSAGRCTGILVSRQVALTAAHCLVSRASRQLARPSSVHFVLGFNRGHYLFNITAKKFVIAPDYRPEAPMSHLASDWALLVLEDPAPETVPQLLPLENMNSANTFVVAGYAQDRSQILTHSRPCEIIGNEHTSLIHTNCDVPHGYSGGPLMDPGSGRVAGLNIATAPSAESQVSLAIAPHAWAAALKSLIADGL